MSAFSNIETYMNDHELDSVIIGKHSVHGHFTALRTSRVRTLRPNHGAGETAEAALQDLMRQDESGTPTSQRQRPTHAATADDEFEDLLG